MAETSLGRPYSLLEVISNRPLDFESVRIRRTFPLNANSMYTRGNAQRVKNSIVVPSLPKTTLGLMQNICILGWYHPIDYELFYFNIRRNVRNRVNAFLSTRPLFRAPPFSCIILTRPFDADKKIYMECRDMSAAVAANAMTCFGGKRELNETAIDCAKRECREELAGWESTDKEWRLACNLYVDEFFIATFFVSIGPTADEETLLKFEDGRTGRWISTKNPSISKWHQSAINAWELGEKNAHFATTNASERTELERLIEEREKFHTCAQEESIHITTTSLQ